MRGFYPLVLVFLAGALVVPLVRGDQGVRPTTENARQTRETFSYSHALLNPDARCPEYVQARKFNGGGLGHSFMAFNHLVAIASAHNVTVKARYTSTGHGTDGKMVDAFFFGDFFDAPLPPTISKTTIVNCSTVDEFTSNLAKNRANGCVQGTAMVYEIAAEIPPREINIDSRLYRKAFAQGDAFRRAYIASHENQVDDSLTNSGGDSFSSPRTNLTKGADGEVKVCTRVAVHIRRGDINAQHLRRRWVPNRSYLHTIDAVYNALSAQQKVRCRRSKIDSHAVTQSAHQPGACRLCIELFVEGATSAAEIPDLDPDNTHGFTNFQDRLARYGSVKVINSDALSSFDRACFSDILITGMSGYSHLISLVCGSPVILAFPFWHSYSYVPNAMMINKNVPVIRMPEGTDDEGVFDRKQFLALVEKHGLSCWRRVP